MRTGRESAGASGPPADVRAARRWRRPPRIRSAALRYALVAGAAAYLAAALFTLPLDPARLAEGIGRGGRMLAAFLRPDFTSRWPDIRDGMLESLAITVVATAAGLVLSLPVGLAAARTLVPRPVYLAARALVVASRSFQEVIVAIVFVVMVGFGPLAGVLTLAVATVGFMGKLLAEEIEAIDPAPLDAIRATGASWAQVVLFGVVPQVAPRVAGLSVYRLDINFRESAVIGVVGAGGIGATLQTAFGRYEFGTAAAVILVIIGIVLAGEIASGRLRRRLV